jgi:hypothetical protein
MITATIMCPNNKSIYLIYITGYNHSFFVSICNDIKYKKNYFIIIELKEGNDVYGQM